MKIDLAKYSLDSWTPILEGKGGGQADIVFLKKKETGEEGVFRLLKSNSEKDKERFRREIRILTDSRFLCESVINILEYSENECWYITPKGMPFDTYWDRKQSREKDINRRLEICLAYIKTLANGLEKLHKNGIIHRDIKHQNIIVLNDVPKLIDFGLAFNDNEERFSSIEDIAANRRYSPDKAMYYQNNPVPWLDVFHLSQLMIWMICKEPTKNTSWQRPLAWEWVVFPKNLKLEFQSRLRAIMAICSEERLSPQNATEFIRLIEKYFPMNEQMSIGTINFDKINKEMLLSLSDDDRAKVEFLKLVKSTIPGAECLFTDCIDLIDEINNKLRENQLFEVIKSENFTFQHWFENVLNEQKPYDTLAGPYISVRHASNEILSINSYYRFYSPLNKSWQDLSLCVYPENGEFIFQFQIQVFFKRSNRNINLFINELTEGRLQLKVFSDGRMSSSESVLNLIEIENKFYNLLSGIKWFD